MRKHRYRRYLLWGAITGAFFDALWRWASREHRWILADCSRSQTGYPPITGRDWA